VDYGLLLTFAAFFLLVDNPETLLPARFALSMGPCRVLSKAPAAIFLAPLTASWKVLLWGVNVGGFGAPVASMANPIALRLFLKGARTAGAFSSSTPSPRRRRYSGSGYSLTGPSGKAKVKLGR